MALILVIANSQKLFSYGLLKVDSGLQNIWIFGQRLLTRVVHHSFLKRFPEYTKNTKNTKDFCPSKGVKYQNVQCLSA